MGQRLRITFALVGGLRYLSHLETMKLWERAMRRAGWRLSYSQGFNPHPKISFAAALPVGVAGETELMDVQLEAPRSSEVGMAELNEFLPAECRVLEIREIRVDAPVIQKLLKAAEYRALCPSQTGMEDVSRGVARVLAAATLPRERKKERSTVAYDLRPMIHWLRVEELDGMGLAVLMGLRTDTQGAGRPDEVLRELGIDPADCEITRLRLVLEERETGDGQGGRSEREEPN
jgi:radical SAM-linked protein